MTLGDYNKGFRDGQITYIQKKINSIESELDPKYGGMLEMLNNLKADLKKLSKN